jgi:hypothetical protein
MRVKAGNELVKKMRGIVGVEVGVV